jgi:hypothetical protein
MVDEISVQLATDVPLSRYIKRQLVAQASRHLHRYKRLRSGLMRLHLKHDGPQYACHLHLTTERGNYNSAVSGWDVRSILLQGLESIDLQVAKALRS